MLPLEKKLPFRGNFLVSETKQKVLPVSPLGWLSVKMTQTDCRSRLALLPSNSLRHSQKKGGKERGEREREREKRAREKW